MLSLADRLDAHIIMQREVGYRRAMQAAGLAERARVLRLPVDATTQRHALAAYIDATDRPRQSSVGAI